jgi:hypothetical protein
VSAAILWISKCSGPSTPSPQKPSACILARFLAVGGCIFPVGAPVLGDHLSVNEEKGIFTVVKAPGAVFGTVKDAL